jgi:cytoskeletal protein CcmA (bactofilin family)
MFKKRTTTFSPTQDTSPAPADRITSVLGSGMALTGKISGSGGLRIEGSFEGDVTLRGLLVVGETGRVTANKISANTVIIAGAVKGDITAEKLEIRSTGRVWGNVVTASFSTEEGAFLRGQIRMEERVDIELPAAEEPVIESEENLVLEPEAGEHE